jgi:hypothetical protein
MNRTIEILSAEAQVSVVLTVGENRVIRLHTDVRKGFEMHAVRHLQSLGISNRNEAEIALVEVAAMYA